MSETSTQFVLASGSPRRREMIGALGLPVRVTRVEIDETPRADEEARAYTLRLSREKAAAAAREFPDALILAADTTVADDGAILGKPRDKAEAWAMLRRLRGRTHQVYTALTLWEPRSGRRVSEVARTDVPMRDYTDAEIAAYIASGDPFDKAGGYAIQHAEFRPVTLRSGCYANVMGLPLCHLVRALRAFGVAVSVDVPALCRERFGYTCDVAERILAGDA